MSKHFMLLALAAMLVVCPGRAQQLSLRDTSVTFKNPDGKILNRTEAEALMAGGFAMRQEWVNGKKIVTILPATVAADREEDPTLAKFRQRFIGMPLGAFRLLTLEGDRLEAKKLRGKVLVLNFWFTGCKPCITEIPHLNKLVEENQGKQVVFIAPAPESEPQVRKFLKKYPFDYSIIPSSLDYINQLMIGNFPTHIIADREGIIRQVFIGYAEDIREKLQAGIDKLLD